MKKIVCYLLSLLLIFVFSACSPADEAENESDTSSITEDTSSTESKVPVKNQSIGRIVTYSDFLTEFQNRVDLSKYELDLKTYDESVSCDYFSKSDYKVEQKESNFRVKIDGIEFTLPLSLGEFYNLGFKLTSTDSEVPNPVDLDSLARSASFSVTTPKGNTFLIYAISKDYSQIAIKDFIVTQVECRFYEGRITYALGARANAPTIEFFERINTVSTVDDIVKELKAPDEIYFDESKYEGKTTLSDLQLKYRFSNEKYDGSISITTHPTPDGYDLTSYTSSFSYLIDYESIKNS